MTNPHQRASDQNKKVYPVNSSAITYVDHYAEDLLSVFFDGVIGINKEGKINFINKTACNITGWRQEEVKNQSIENIFQFYNELIEQPFLKIINNIINSSQFYGPILTHKIKSKKNNTIIVNFSISPLDGNNVILMFHEVHDKIKKKNPPLLYQFSYDTLTHLANRTALQKSIHHLHNDYKKNSNSYSLILLDIDRFKLINDNYGHKNGDILLQLFAERMQLFLRNKDNIGRWGGEEFLCILPDTNIKSAYAIAQRICQNIAAKPFLLNGQEVPITVSIGISNFPKDGNNPEDLFRVADATLHEAKRNGRNRIHSSQQVTGNLYSIGAQLENALNENRITPIFQPIFEISSGKQMAKEALARIQDEKGNLIEANTFIDAAVELQMVHRIDHQIFKKMITRCTENLIENKNVFPHFVNLSADLLRHPKLVNDIIQFAKIKFQQCGLSYSSVKPIVIEITEQEFIHDDVNKILAPFIDFGFPLAIDDFGSGYSSLKYLADLPISYLKFDGTLIKRIAHEDRARKIIAGIQKMAESLNLITIAEHIENQATLDVLSELGVTWGQGYYSAKPAE